MKKTSRILALVFSLVLLLSVLAIFAFANGEDYVARVDGVGYKTEEEVASAIREGSELEILADFNAPIEKSGVGFTAEIGTFRFYGFVSETHKVVLDGSRASIVPASSDEIFTLTYNYGEISATQTAALGTTIKAPSAFDKYPMLDEEMKSYTVLHYILPNGTDKVSGDAEVQITEQVIPALVVKWCAEDGVTVLDTDYYFPGTLSSLPEFSGEDIQDDVSPEWYSYGRVAWNEEDLRTLEGGLFTSGEYTIRAVMGKKAPDVIPGLKINLTLYSNYLLNFYIPEDVEGIENIFVSASPDGSILLNQLESGYIDDVRYAKFSYLFGAADTSIMKFYIFYTVDGEKISYELEYGVPIYAASAMKQLPCEANFTKTLIVNIANYADKMCALENASENSLGARVYEEIVELYGEEFLGYYNSLSHEKFLEGGEIYISDGVASTKTGEAMKYVDSLSFSFDLGAPAYLLRLSEEALASEGLSVWVAYGDGEFIPATKRDDGAYVSYAGNGEEGQKSLSISKISNNVKFDFRLDGESLGIVEYNLASYLSFMLSDKYANLSFIEAAKALYAFSVSAKEYSENKDVEEGLPCLDFTKDHYCDTCEKKISECSDSVGNHDCDVCEKKLKKLCIDSDKNNICDECGCDLKYKYVIVIGVDGGGAFFEKTETPNLDKIFADGAVSYDVLTEIPSISAQNWGAILHGVKAGVHGCTNTNTLQGNNNGVIDTTVNRFKNDSIPSFLRVVKEAMPSANVASITNWANISYGMVEDGLGIYMPYLDTDANNTDRDVTDTILEYVDSCNPTALFIQLNEADTFGHRYGYGTDQHLAKITELDAYIGEIYAAYEEKGIIEDTLFIVTADHGGTPTKEGGATGGDHGGITEAEMHVMFAAAGASVKEGTIQDMEVRDTAAVVLYALGLEAPKTYTARVPSGIFGGVMAPESRPAYVNPEADRYHETEETPTGDKYVSNFVTSKPLAHYFNFDKNANDSVGSLNTELISKITYSDAYYGEGINLEAGYVNVPEFSFGEDSWTISMWLDTRGAAPDPVILGNKDWGRGINYGFALVINQSGKLTLNIGNGESRYDFAVYLPDDYRDGPVHIMLVIDKENAKLRFIIDFNDVHEKSINATMLEVLYSTSSFNIGQDGTGKYNPLTATLDELMFFRGAFTSEDVEAFARYNGKKVDNIRNQENKDTPTEGSEGYIGNYVDKYIGDDLILYMPFDGNANAVTGQTTATSGAVSFEEGFFGEAIRVKDGSYATVDGITLGTGSYTFSFWLKQEEAQHDPCIIATKNWSSGAQKGFLIASKIYQGTPQYTVNFGNGSSRADVSVNAPGNFNEGWMHLALVIDKTNNQAHLYVDFKLAGSKDISIFAGESVTTTAKLVIGQQLNGNYEDKLNAALDELMIFDGALTANGIRALSKYYGVEKLAYNSVIELPEIEEAPEVTIRDHVNVDTPLENAGGYIGNYLVGNDLLLYMPFDGNTSAVTGQDTVASGTITYEEGFFGDALRLKDGNYVTINGLELGSGDTTFAFWFKMDSVPSGDPIFLSTKDWSAAKPGFVLASRWGGAHFNLGNGTNHCYYTGSYPADVTDGWCHLIVSIDRTSGNVVMYFDFGAVSVAHQGTALGDMAGDPLSHITSLIVGNRPGGGYTPMMDSAIDELMVFDGAFDENDVRALSKYYGVENFVFGSSANIDGMGSGIVSSQASVRNPNPNGKDTPAANSGKYVTDFVTGKDLELYVNFDGEGTTTATGQGYEASAGTGSYSYEDGVFGDALTIKDGAYATVSGISLGSGSYTFSFWLKMNASPSGDPAIISTKNWNSGAAPGFIISTKLYESYTQTVATLANGNSNDRVNCAINNPDDCYSGWTHVTVVIDKENKKIQTYYDFELVKTVSLIDNLLEQTITQTSGAYKDIIRIGQDLEADYGKKLNASLDELMVFEGAFTADDVRALSRYYGLESVVFGN